MAIKLLSALIASFFLTLGHVPFVSWGKVKQANAQQNLNKSPQPGITFAGGSGESFEKAIIIKGATNSGAGIAAEYQYLEKKFGRRNADWKLIRQGLLHKNAKHFDLMQIELADGTQKDIYFDITEFFGKL